MAVFFNLEKGLQHYMALQLYMGHTALTLRIVCRNSLPNFFTDRQFGEQIGACQSAAEAAVKLACGSSSYQMMYPSLWVKLSDSAGIGCL